MIFRQLFDPETSTYTYLLADPQTRDAVIIDPVLERVERDLRLLDELNLRLAHVLETHVHADHITGAAALRDATGAQVVLSKASGAEGADRYVGDDDSIRFGNHALEVRATPGHTNGCVTYVCADRTMAFTGDALLIRGSGRTDFQQGDARKLYRSVHDKILSLPDDARLFPGHDYQGRTVSTVGEEKAFNVRLGGDRTEDEFVTIMNELGLAYPKRIDVALPANLVCGAIAGIANSDQEVPSPWSRVQRNATGVPEVTLDWLDESRPAVRLIDVRQPHEFTGELGHIDGAELVPLDELPHEARRWDREQEIVTVCRSGGRSGTAALELEALGFRHVASLAGGMLKVRTQQVQTAHAGGRS